MDESPDQDVHETLSAFEAAVHATPVDLPAPRIERLLVVLDGSNQDETTLALAQAVAAKSGAVLHLLYAYEGDPQAERDAYLTGRIDALRAAGVTLAELDRRPELRPWDQILAAREATGADLIVVDAPYLEDFAELGADSVGTTLDMLLARSSVPLLVARSPFVPVSDDLEEVSLATVFAAEDNVRGAGWALACLKSSGTLHVLVIADTGNLEAISHLLENVVDIQALDESTLLDLESKDKAGLIAILQRTAAETGIQCRVITRVGEALHILTEELADLPGLIVVSRPHRKDSKAYEKVLALVRASQNSLLIV